MFGQRIINHIKECMPELQDLQLSVSGNPIHIGGYEMLNALLIQNNVLDDTSKSIAIFHSKEDLLDIYLLVIMGIATYKSTIISNAKLKQNDFMPGELVEYNGKVVHYGGIILNSVDNIERFKISYDDKYHTSEEIPLQFFSELSKYQGNKTTADSYDSKRAKENVKDTLKSLLGSNLRQIGLSGYSPFLIASERSRLVELLKETTINGIAFFDMFPSVKCTSEKRQRLGRDNIQRAFLFYFVSSLSTADDILQPEPSIKNLLVDARGKVLNNGSLLSSIRTQYNLEDIYWLQNYDRLDSIDKLDSGLGFNIWIWSKEDFADLILEDYKYIRKPINSSNDLFVVVENHNLIPYKLARYADLPVEVPYPNGLTLEQHNLLQTLVRDLFLLCNDYGNVDLQKITFHLASIASRAYQSPISLDSVDIILNKNGKRTCAEDIAYLDERLQISENGILPEEFRNKALELLEKLKFVVDSFKGYSEKCNQAALLIRENVFGKVCVLTNSKFSSTNTITEEKIIAELNRLGFPSLRSKIIVTDKLTQAVGCDAIIWTFKPTLTDTIMVEPRVEKNFILLYPLQKKSFELSLLNNIRHYMRYRDLEYRAGILKIPIELLENASHNPIQTVDETEIFDLEKMISTTLTKILPTYQNSGKSEMVNAKMVLFSDGSQALFQTGHKIKVLDMEHETIETKTVNSLSEGDEVAFLSDKKTIFDELVSYYEHDPKIIELIKLSELWRTALIEYKEKNYFGPGRLKKALDEVGLVRLVVTIENWLDGTTVCPDEDNYAPVDIIAMLTNNTELKENIEAVKDAARKIHGFRINIGRYLAKKITQSYVSPDSIIDDPVLRNKLDEVSSHVRIARVFSIDDEVSQVPIDMTNKLLTEDDV